MYRYQGRIYHYANETKSVGPRNNMPIKKNNKQISELRKIHLLVWEDWNKSVSLAKTMFVESVRTVVRILGTPIEYLIDVFYYSVLEHSYVF